jgi:ketosteroid isomerase-like protein
VSTSPSPRRYSNAWGTEDGKKVAFTLRLTIGLEKHNGEWIIVHEHHSQPLDFDTARIGTGSS